MMLETFGTFWHRCSKTKAFCLHACVLKKGLQSHVFISNQVLIMYARCGHVFLARRVFDEMSQRNLVSWSAMISGYDQCGVHWMALHLFSQMQLLPNEYTFASALSACASLAALKQGQMIHARSLKSGYASVSFVSNSLITMYMKCGRCSDAFSVYANSVGSNAVSHNALISGFIENHEPEKGFEVFKLMLQRGFVPDRFSFVGLLGYCTKSDDLRRGISLHCQAIKLQLDSTPLIGNLMMTMYAKFNFIEEVERVFRLIEDKDVISWNTLISAFPHFDDQAKCLRFFKEMMNKCSIRPDDFTFASILSSCAWHVSIHHGKQIHGHLFRTRLCWDVGVDNALVNMYAKCGSIGYAHNVFHSMSYHNLVSWNTIIAAFGNHGLGEKAIEMFEQMKRRVKPDSFTFIGLLIACNHSGLVRKGGLYFNSMEEAYGVAPNIEHFSCLIDMLGRAGRLSVAEEYMKKFPQWNDPVVLGSLLSACWLHGNMVIGERLAKKLLEVQPVTTTSPYVLLSNLYASDGMWNDVTNARKMLKDNGLRKEPGYSMVEVKGNHEKFTIGDFSHLRMEEIKNALITLNCQVDKVFADDIT